MKRRHFGIAAGLAALACIVALTARAPAAPAAPFTGKPEIVAATFSSAWCSACKILEPKLARVIPQFESDPVAFVKFDFTFGARDELASEAARWRIGDLYERNKGATGFTVLVDYDTGEILDTLTMNFSEEAMRGAVARAIAIASHTDQQAEQAAD